MDSQKLIGRIVEAFEAEDTLSFEEVTPHRCEECDELAVNLDGLSPLEVQLDLLYHHRWDLPLLSEEAKRYYLPAWMLASIQEPDSDFTDALVMNLDSDHRNGGYSEVQKSVVLDYLRYIRDRGSHLDDHAIERAERRWT